MHTVTWVVVAVFPLIFLALQLVIGVRSKTPRADEKYPAVPAEMILRMCALTFMVQYITSGKPWIGVEMPAAVELLGIGVIVAGLIWLIRAQTVLGRNWVPGVGLHKKHQLVTDGPYRRVRHPIYSALGLSVIGLAIASGDLMMLFGGACLFAALAVRIPHEEALMAKKFKKKWDRYAAATPAVIPRWR